MCDVSLIAGQAWSTPMHPLERLKEFAGVGSLLVSIVALLVSLLTAVATLSTNTSQFNRRLVADLRPWVSVKPTIKNIYVSYGKIRNVYLTYELENHGRAAALNVDISAVGVESNSDSKSAELLKRCEDAQGSSAYSFFKTLVLLPQQSLRVADRFLALSYILEGYNLRNFHIVGCVTYSTQVDGLQHVTGFAYDTNIESVGKYASSDFSGEVASSDLGLSPQSSSKFAIAD